MPGDSVLEVSSLSVAFGGIRALNDVALEVAPGEIVGLVGANGSGKSTLLNAVGNLLKGAQVSGRVAVLGVTGRRPPEALCRQGMGRSFQNPTLLEDSTVMDNLLCGAHTALGGGWLAEVVRPKAARREEAALHRRAVDLLSAVGLADQATDVVARKPYGTRKLIDILRAFMTQPKLALLDEPTSGLDARDRAVVADLLRRVQGMSDTAMLVVEHHFELLSAVADRVVALAAGQVVLTGTPTQVFESEEFRTMLTGRERSGREGAWSS